MNDKSQSIRFSPNRTRGGFTLMELLMVLLIITIIAALSLSALAGATEMAREQRTRAIIMKIDLLIQEQFDGYRTRAVPIRIPPTMRFDTANPDLQSPTPPNIIAGIRLYAMRDLMRMEMPDRITDLTDVSPVLYTSPCGDQVRLFTSPAGHPSLMKAYQRKATRALGASWPTLWTDQYQGAECLYLIISMKHNGDKNAIDYFSDSEIGDVDGDGMKEILDAWGNPIEFLRWAPGYLQPDVVTDQDSSYVTNTVGTLIMRSTDKPDPFDPVKADPRWYITAANPQNACYALRPLIYSAGRNKEYDIAGTLVNGDGTPFHYAVQSPPNDPYFSPQHHTGFGTQLPIGTPTDANGNGVLEFGDNITNHYVEAQ